MPIPPKPEIRIMRCFHFNSLLLMPALRSIFEPDYKLFAIFCLGQNLEIFVPHDTSDTILECQLLPRRFIVDASDSYFRLAFLLLATWSQGEICGSTICFDNRGIERDRSRCVSAKSHAHFRTRASLAQDHRRLPHKSGRDQLCTTNRR